MASCRRHHCVYAKNILLSLVYLQPIANTGMELLCNCDLPKTNFEWLSYHLIETFNLDAVATLPRLPPPEPPRTFVEIHEIRVDTDSDVGYLRPSIHRHDGIPGDVRSPPPAGRPAFEFPATPDGRR